MSVTALVAVTAAAVLGCEAPSPPPGGGPSVSTAPPVTAAPTTEETEPERNDTDYTHLLLAASDISDAEDTFAVWSTTPDPGGLPGASALFVNAEDTRAISNTIAIYPDAATATTTLRQALPGVGRVVTGGIPRPLPVGTDGTVVVGMSPDGTKAATLLLFTHGPALARLQFESAPGDATTDEYVATVGKMQLIALRTGLHEER
ncbi:hypothetical protein ACQI4L_10945 [Mycolicibacterium litorale]|uniref:hypothetical protein n=1 Tax=Mycolicibacterium litorale TaxID=758802 RepID=UPI003CEECA8B